MIELSAEQRQLAKIIHEYVCPFPLTELGDAQVLQSCYDYMDALKMIIDSSSDVQMRSICQQYSGFLRFAKLMEQLAQGIENGVIEVPKDH